jgi:ribosomal protein L4
MAVSAGPTPQRSPKVNTKISALATTKALSHQIVYSLEMEGYIFAASLTSAMDDIRERARAFPTFW